MANMGLIGAIGGLGAGMAGTAEMELEEAKQARLEELRAKNNQATNSMNNRERHNYALTEADVSHGYRMDEIDQGYNYSLEELAAKSDKEKELLRLESELDASAPTPDEKNARFWNEEGGIPYADQYEDGQYSANINPPSKVAEGEYLRSLGADEGTVRDYVLGKLSSDQLRQELVVSMTKESPYSSPEEILEKANQIVSGLSNGAVSPNPAAQSGSQKTNSARQFSSMSEALEAAKKRYPGVDESVLQQRLRAKYPDLK